jgi:hypothetical protein
MKPLLARGIVIEPVTVSEMPELIFRFEFPPPVAKVNVEQLAAAVTVIVLPTAIVTRSADVGTVPPGQGAFGVVEFQFPLPALVIDAAIVPVVMSRLKRTIIRRQVARFFIFAPKKCEKNPTQQIFVISRLEFSG